jgi:2-polyprenyl-3-methyl-5-hydroxy-6-metoxy-1,4-benzoquinol methylase
MIEAMETRTVKQHYEEHLSSFYGWMLGDFESCVTRQVIFFRAGHIVPFSNAIAIDLGAGTGIQTCALARLGFKVTAVDFDKQLLRELQTHCKEENVHSEEQDMITFVKNTKDSPELITCMGDTLTHLRDMEEVKQLIDACFAALISGGKLIFTFRNYTTALHGDNRFIPVKSDDSRILTCLLEYYPTHVFVTDLLYEKIEEEWKYRVSSYTKVRIDPEAVVQYLTEMNMHIEVNDTIGALHTIIAQKAI